MQQAVAEIVDDHFLGPLRERRRVGDERLQREASIAVEDGLLEREEGVEMGGHHEGAGGPRVVQLCQNDLRLEGREHFAASAEKQRGMGKGEAGAVKQRGQRQIMV
ncbi:hypothetical protein D3C83_64280 [compost metagenome]